MQKTDRTCPVCENGVFQKENYALFCSNCHFAPVTSKPRGTTDPWMEFWSHRKNEYSGTYGKERRKCVGGFVGAYDL